MCAQQHCSSSSSLSISLKIIDCIFIVKCTAVWWCLVVVVVDNFKLRLWGAETTLIPPTGLRTPADSFLGTILFFTDITTVLEPERDRWPFFFSFHTHTKKEWGGIYTRPRIDLQFILSWTAGKQPPRKEKRGTVNSSNIPGHLNIFYSFSCSKRKSPVVFFF
jgi:hypothetical protein